MPLISVVVPVYNAETFLNKCIDSILGQTFKNFELILVDDGSTDSSLSICENYEKLDSRVKSAHQSNQGPMAAIKKGISLASSEYIAFIDSDDYVDIDFLELLAEAAVNSGCDYVVTGIISENRGKSIRSRGCILEDGIYNKAMLLERLYPVLLYNQTNSQYALLPSRCGKLYRTSILLSIIDILPDELRYGEDWILNLAYLLNCGSMCVLDQQKYHYGVNPGSLTRVYRSDMLQIVLARFSIQQQIIKTYTDYDFSDQQELLYIDTICRVLYQSTGRFHSESFKKVRKNLRAICEDSRIRCFHKWKSFKIKKKGLKPVALSLKYNRPCMLTVYLWILYHIKTYRGIGG